MEIIGAKHETGKPAIVLMADSGRYVGGTFVRFKADKRRRLSHREARPAPPPKGLAN